MKPTNLPLFSIMMPAFNAESYIQESINSILAQSYPHWELIIINDGSTDQTAAIIAENKDERIHSFHQKNQGEAAARNHALSKMTGEWAAFLDSDDLFEADFLQQTITFLNQNKALDAVYTDGRYIDSIGKLMEPLSAQRRGPFHGDIFEQVVRASDVFGPPTCTVLNLNKIREHKLRFDTRIVIGPDWDFLTRYAEIGRFGYLDYYGVRYRVHQTNITLSTSSAKRRESLTICRQKQITNPRFESCSAATKYFVFYDLLVNLTYDQPHLQEETMRADAFQNLPAAQQAKLLRLMIHQAVMQGVGHPFLKHWLQGSLRLNAWDFKTWFSYLLFSFNTGLLRFALSHKPKRLQNQSHNSPFDLKP